MSDIDGFRMAMDDVPVAILVVRRDYQITFANRQCHILFGYDAGELLGKQLEILVPPESRETHLAMAEEYWKDLHPKHLGSGRDLQGLTKNNTCISVEIGLYPHNDNIIVFVLDVLIRHTKDISDELKNLAVQLEKTIKVLDAHK